MLPEIKAIDYTGCVLSDDDVSDRLKQLKNIVLENEYLKANLRTDDKYLLRFLNSSEFNVNLAYQRIDQFYNFLKQYGEWFEIGDWRRNEHLLYENMRCMLPGRDKQGRSIYVCKMGKLNPAKISIKEVVRLDNYWLEYKGDDVFTQRKGLAVIIDVAGYSWKVMQWLTPGNIKFGLNRMENITVKETIIHVVNTSFLVDASVKIIWPFLSQKIKDSIKFHFKNFNSLHEHIDPDQLPKEYGGTADMSYEKEIEKLIAKNDEIHEDTKYIDFFISS